MLKFTTPTDFGVSGALVSATTSVVNGNCSEVGTRHRTVLRRWISFGRYRQRWLSAYLERLASTVELSSHIFVGFAVKAGKPLT